MDQLKLFAAPLPAKTRAQRTRKGGESMAHAPRSSSRQSAWSANSDPIGSALRTFLASELEATTGYTMAWKHSTTSQGRSWWVLGTPAHPTAETALSLLPTARASDADRGGRGDLIQALRGNPNKHFTMPTPRPRSGKRSRGVNQTELERSLLPTPTKQAGGAWTPPHGTEMNLKAALLATPLARDWRSGKTSEATAAKNSRPLSEQSSRAGLNGTADLLRLVEWLMGYPPRWLLSACEAMADIPTDGMVARLGSLKLRGWAETSSPPTEIPSSRSSRKSSAGSSSKPTRKKRSPKRA